MKRVILVASLMLATSAGATDSTTEKDAAAIRAANKLSNDKIRVGQTLSIPIYAGS